MSTDTVTHTLEIDRSACAGHGMCYGTRPEIVDCDDQGYPVIPEPLIGPGDLAAARDVVAVCPERALALVPREA